MDEFAASRIKHYGAKSAFLGYRKYPCQICISVNDQVVHGLAGSRTLQFGDIVSLDVGVIYNGFIGDTARTVAVGGCDVLAQKLMDVTEKALYEGIAQARAGQAGGWIFRGRYRITWKATVSASSGSLWATGWGASMHEEPQVPNFVDGKSSPKLRPGMTLAIEPMVNAGAAGRKNIE